MNLLPMSPVRLLPISPVHTGRRIGGLQHHEDYCLLNRPLWGRQV